MANSLNKVMIIGSLGRDPEVRSFQSGDKVASLNVATTESWKDKNTGEKKEKTEWHNVSLFGDGLVRVAEQYLRKGSKVYIEGQLQTRKWQDQSGQDRYTTEIVVRGFNGSLIMLSPRGSNSGAGQQQASAPAQTDPFGGNGDPFGDMDDDVPF